MYILGIWDGHDAGAAIAEGGVIKVAINEERLSKRKLDVGFPRLSIQACLNYLGLKPTDINIVAASTSDFSKTLTRIFPSLKESYYLFRRRKIEKPRFVGLRRAFKYNTTTTGNLHGICKRISEYYLKKELKNLGLAGKLYIVDHHLAHAAGACYASGFSKALCLTLDGVGDALSGSVNIFENGAIKRIAEIPARDSIGIFFEQVTTLLGFRELEDEGKVMCMADYSYPIEDEKNRMMDFFSVDGLKLKARFPATKMYSHINRIVWNHPREQVAYMAQRVLEKNLTKLFENTLEETGLRNVCWAGGVAANVKANMRIRLLPQIKNWFVFPHMGDGGLAAGAALYVSNLVEGTKPYRMADAYLGPEYSDDEIEDEIKKNKLKYEEGGDIAEHAADIISKENYVFWFQGRMEFGPRALGNRSILAPAGSERIKDLLNIKVKKREWYQPFCPSVLDTESRRLFKDVNGVDSFMTMAYMAKEDKVDGIKSVINVDGSSRPQMLQDENKGYRRLLRQVKKNTGNGIVLNTSFNLHGFPIVLTPADAIDTMLKTNTRYMAMGNFFVENKK
ncbi:MAG: hypothetical protein HYT72_03530 [Candidatus Aenigmarchaeota archaeon]|nr:hypothetical protein [Candidatus Aenigmarchaeota archaeon]